MITKYEVDLSKHSHMRVGGIAKRMHIPETTEELCSIIKNLQEDNSEYHIIAGGSNILINDRKVFDNVINLLYFNKDIRMENNIIICGASVRIQKLINFINENGFGGIEYLYSVPGSVGGAVYMNAGRGKKHNKAISDYIVEIEIFDGEKLVNLNKQECEFMYRKSIFQKKNWIITSIKFKFDNISLEESTNRKEERMNYSKKYLDNRKGNLGSIFRQFNPYMILLLKIVGYGDKKGAHFSKKTRNWIINEGDATFEDINGIISNVEKVHRFLGMKIDKEIIIWE